MQLDQYRIAIRERGYLEVLDLALRVIAGHALPLAAALLAGILPLAVLNAWLLGHFIPTPLAVEVENELPPFAQFFENAPAWYLWCLLVFVIWEAPLATAPATLLLGQSLFAERPQAGQLGRSFLGSLPQLLLYQVLWRGLLVLPGIFILPALLWLLPFAQWPYLNEIILLERNPVRGGRTHRVTTGSRRKSLHSGLGGDLFARWLLSIALGGVLFLSLWLSLWLLTAVLFDAWTPEGIVFTVFWPLALWAVMGFFAVVRFLSYLDLRIRREGWEVELLMRAEEARLTRQWT